jgi:hypothetical protein
MNDLINGFVFQSVHAVGVDDTKLLFEPIERLIQKSGKCQPFLSVFDPRLIFIG